jgi:iron complex transport system permease protein
MASNRWPIAFTLKLRIVRGKGGGLNPNGGTTGMIEAGYGIPARTGAFDRLTPRRLLVTLAILAAALLVIAAVAIAVGAEHVSLSSIARIVASGVTGRSVDDLANERSIITQIRLPRVLMAILVGASLSVAGAAYQSLLRNPLADPGILGISTGAALGAIVAIAFASSIPVSRHAAAFAGALATTAVVYGLGQMRRGASSERLVLAGVITNTFLSSAVIHLLTTVPALSQKSAFSWLMGDLNGEIRVLPAAAILGVVGIAVIFLNARNLNMLMVGEEDAAALGVEVAKAKRMVYFAASLITGGAVAIGGVIGFVGLIIPHGVRLVGGSDNRLVIPGSAFAGAGFLLLADTIARTAVAPTEIHVGVITALIGAPVFIYLLRRTSS